MYILTKFILFVISLEIINECIKTQNSTVTIFLLISHHSCPLLEMVGPFLWVAGWGNGSKVAQLRYSHLIYQTYDFELLGLDLSIASPIFITR